MRETIQCCVILLLVCRTANSYVVGYNSRLPAEFSNHHPQTNDPAFRVFYGSGVSVCAKSSIEYKRGERIVRRRKKEPRG